MAETAAEYPEPRFYSREFKLEAVRLSETSGKSMAQVARELGLADGVLYRWCRFRTWGADAGGISRRWG